MTTFTPLCRLHDLPDGESRGFDPLASGQDSVFVVRRGNHVQAWRDACPHHGTPMAWRRHAYLNPAGDRIVCSAHGALFDIDSGLCVQGPCLGEYLTALPSCIGADGLVGVELATDGTTAPAGSGPVAVGG